MLIWANIWTYSWPLVLPLRDQTELVLIQGSDLCDYWGFDSVWQREFLESFCKTCTTVGKADLMVGGVEKFHADQIQCRNEHKHTVFVTGTSEKEPHPCPVPSCSFIHASLQRSFGHHPLCLSPPPPPTSLTCWTQRQEGNMDGQRTENGCWTEQVKQRKRSVVFL